MYHFVNAYLRQHGKNKTWVSTDISLESLNVVFTKYNDGYLTLQNTVLSATPLYVDFQTLKSINVPFLNLPFETWLQSLGNMVLPTLPSEPIYQTNTITYSDANQACFDITRIHPTFVLAECGPNPVFNNSELRDLYLEKSNINLTDLHNYILPTVNGFVHRVTYTDSGLQIVGGGLSLDVCNQNLIGLISFKNIGAIQQIPITLPMLHQLNNHAARYEYLIETTTDLTDKSVMLSLGGYLHLEDDVLEIVSYNPGIVKISLTRLNVIRRLFEMNKYLNLDTLVHARSRTKGDSVNLIDFYRNPNIAAFLTLPQSFLIVVDATNLYYEREIVGRALFPNTYEHGVEPTVPLRTSTGRLPEYWRTLEHDTWVMSLEDTLQRNYLHDSTEWSTDSVINSRLSEDGLTIGKAHLFYIRSKKPL